jgi:hypothetical protein
MRKLRRYRAEKTAVDEAEIALPAGSENQKRENNEQMLCSENELLCSYSHIMFPLLGKLVPL